MFILPAVLIGLLVLFSIAAFASGTADHPDLTLHPAGLAALLIFLAAYLLVMAEEFLHLRKSKPVVIAAGLIWAMLAYVSAQQGAPHAAEQAVRHAFLDFAELMLFLLVAMTYINALAERQRFRCPACLAHPQGLRVARPVLDDRHPGLFHLADRGQSDDRTPDGRRGPGGGRRQPHFVTLSCINIVVAANAGGAFSPFGDITTLMVWQKGIIDFLRVFRLFIPALVNWLVPAVLMHFAVPDLKPDDRSVAVTMKRGARRIIALFLFTIATAVSFHQFLTSRR